MIGWSRRNAEASRRRQRWLATLTPEERSLEERYQKEVAKRFFILCPAFGLLAMGLICLVGNALEKDPRNPVLAYLLVMLIFVPFIAPFLFIPTKAKWRRCRKEDGKTGSGGSGRSAEPHS